ncbi:MAG: hypothetical protein FLDDKLPJ_00704 [Phycisphaerae bacterium]|nr:hypothetical protein [Phycisphaerae bacterium]
MKGKRFGGQGLLGACAAALLLTSSVRAGAMPDGDAPITGSEPALFEAIEGVREFSGRLIVRPVQVADWIKQGVSQQAAVDRHAEAHAAVSGFEVANYVPQTDEYLVTLPPGMTEDEIARTLLATGNFQYAEPDWLVYPLGCPNDTRFGNQWHHAANRINSCAGWDLHTGDPSVSVGICDTGIRVTHEDFQLHRLEGYNAVDQRWESQGGQINDLHGHGTATTGCAAANGNNGKGIAGVGWDLSHRMLRVSNNSGGGSSLSTLQHAARTAVEAGDKVASVSYSGVDADSNLTTATYVKSIGGLMIWAAGNEGRNLTLSNRDSDDLLVIGATDQNDSKASFSNFGVMVDFTAPGVDVYTCSNGSDTSYGGASGTSFACPLAAGLAALVWSRNPQLDPDTVEEVLKLSCDDLGSQGVDNTYGYGRIDVYEALGRGGSGEPVLGACCFNDGSCSDQFAQDCRNAGGSWKFNETCGTFQCPQPGACCVDDARCEVVLERDCNGTFAGEGSSCERQCPCDRVKKFRAACSSAGTMKVIVKFRDNSFDGEVLGITIGDVEYAVGVLDGKAKLFAGPFSGSQTATLTTPNCAMSSTAQCP